MFFFFFKQKTAYEMRISDWSSDVCSSDLPGPVRRRGSGGGAGRASAGSRFGPGPVVRTRIVLHAGRDVSAARRRALLPRRLLSGRELPGQDSTQTRLRPSSLARYSAASAAAIRPARLSHAHVTSALRMLLVIHCDLPPGVHVSAAHSPAWPSANQYASTRPA